MSDLSLVNENNARRSDIKEALDKIVESKQCPFCSKDYLEKEHKKPIIFDGQFWLATENRWPYEGAKEHLLFIHKAHITHIGELEKGAWQELQEIAITIAKQRGIGGGTLIMRFGDSRYTGATVTHLHAQLICGDPEHPDRKPVLARVG